ncbi:beta barrel domain-containing protein [Acinetobacter brisouii]|uniref:beta barrel domain-containing protein n=1 Tax=Acinetobacter brisouii TaxID=396323 RepID=UPI00124F22FF|nr:hypothetical protein [Acinetobacter brisouii]
MIKPEHLKVGNTVYATPSWCGEAVITKVGRKYTYTTSHNFVIDNNLLMTKFSDTGVSHHEVYESKEAFNCDVARGSFTHTVKQAIKTRRLTFEQAKQINELLGFGIELPH